MQILAVDIGTGTQDILLFDTTREPENALKMVVPSPTVLVGAQITAASQAGQTLLLTGLTMGGGPSTWALEHHKAAGGQTFATAAAARTFNDDLDAVTRDLNITLVSDDEAQQLQGQSHVAHIQMRDFDFPTIHQAFGAFGVSLSPDILALAVFDHGHAPPDESDRKFRFDYLQARLATVNHAALPGLAAFAFLHDQIPPDMTRLQAVAHSAPSDIPTIVMDTAPAAVLGACEDPHVGAAKSSIVVNVGNFHTLAFALADDKIHGLFEHHTGLINSAQLEDYIRRLASGTLTNAELFEHHGHGAIVFAPTPGAIHAVSVTGPRRGMLRHSALQPYFAVPHGDMMMAGCFGLIRACAVLQPTWCEEIDAALAR